MNPILAAAEGDGHRSSRCDGELVLARDIPFCSLCMHHLLPFHGVAHVACLPAERIVGPSKLARVVELFSRDLQVQERLTTQVAAWLQERLEPKGVGVVLEAEHSCMSLRGVRATGAETVTSALHGLIRDDPCTREELLNLGAEPRRLPLPGGELDGVRYLRTIEDSEEICARIDAGGRLVTIGAGWIGAEIAASARQRGCDVTILEAARLPLERVLGPQLGAIYRDIHTDHGAQFVGEAQVEAIEGDRQVTAVRLADGRRIEADFVAVGVGVAPRIELAQAAGLKVDNGVAVDARPQTSAPTIYAAGDIANAWHPFYDTVAKLTDLAPAATAAQRDA